MACIHTHTIMTISHFNFFLFFRLFSATSGHKFGIIKQEIKWKCHLNITVVFCVNPTTPTMFGKRLSLSLLKWIALIKRINDYCRNKKQMVPRVIILLLSHFVAIDCFLLYWAATVENYKTLKSNWRKVICILN